MMVVMCLAVSGPFLSFFLFLFFQPLVVPFGYGACEHNLGGEIFPHSGRSLSDHSADADEDEDTHHGLLSVSPSASASSSSSSSPSSPSSSPPSSSSASRTGAVGGKIERCANGRCAGDLGWPKNLVLRGNSAVYPAPWDSPNREPSLWTQRPFCFSLALGRTPQLASRVAFLLVTRGG